MFKHKSSAKNQQGIISIMMTMVIMIVISLIVIGLAQVSRNEQTQTLNAQLSTQAYYAAESGVNDAVNVIRKMSGIPPAKTSCGNTPAYQFSRILNTNGQDNVKYSCVLIDPTPPYLHYQLSSMPTVITIKPASGGSVGTLTFKWAVPADLSASSYTSCPSASSVSNGNVFKPAAGGASWQCPYGVLRIDIVPATDFSRSGLYQNMMSATIVPTSNGFGGSSAFSSTKGVVAAASNCSSSCQYTFTNMGAKEYYVRVSELYQSGALTVISSAGSFSGAQIMVDSTGKASGVLRRIRVAVDISQGNQNADTVGGLVSGQSVCKKFNTARGYFTGYDSPSAGSPLCQ